MPLAVQRLIFIAFACAAGVAILGLLFYKSAKFNHYDTTLTSHLLAPTGSGRERLSEAMADGGNSGPLALGLLLVSALGLVWKRPIHLLAGVTAFVFANATTQMLKLVLAHPRLQGALGADYPIEIAYPSGHTTGALSLGFALWVTAPPKWRGWAALLGLAYGAAVGIGVILAGWHFISDVIGAILVVGFWAALTLAALVQTGQEKPEDWIPNLEPGANDRPEAES